DSTGRCIKNKMRRHTLSKLLLRREKPARCRRSDRQGLRVLYKSERDDLHMHERSVLPPDRALRPNSIRLPSYSPSGIVGGDPCSDEDPADKAAGDTQRKTNRMSL